MPNIDVSYADDARVARGRRNAGMVDRALGGIRGKRVLEIGCHLGDTTKVLAEEYDCSVVGLDLRETASWAELRKNPRITLLNHDITKPHELLAEDSFDVILSFYVWEHIRHPWSALQVCQKVLKPTGKKWLNANLYRSSIASHLYRTIHEPWPHLMNSPEELMTKYGMTKIDPAFWLNKLTYAQYLLYFRKLGFYIRREVFDKLHFDQDYYDAHEHRLGLYPKWDLETDFFSVVLEFDPNAPKAPIPDPLYLSTATSKSSPAPKRKKSWTRRLSDRVRRRAR